MGYALTLPWTPSFSTLASWFLFFHNHMVHTTILPSIIPLTRGLKSHGSHSISQILLSHANLENLQDFAGLKRLLRRLHFHRKFCTSLKIVSINLTYKIKIYFWYYSFWLFITHNYLLVFSNCQYISTSFNTFHYC